MRWLTPVVALALAAAAAPVAAQSGVELRAEAGLGGIGRLGRWLPVRIAIANSGADVSGDLVVEWGDARLHRAIDAPAPATRVVEIYLRTADVRDSIAVRLLSDGRVIAAASVPIRTVEGDLVVCAGDPAQAGGCTTTIASAAFPQSMRGWDAADEVRVPPGVESRLDPRQLTALRRWREYHDLETAGLLQLAPRVASAGLAPSRPRATTAIASATALLPLVACAWIWARARGSAARSYAALGGAVVVGVLGGVTVGRAGPGAVVVVRQATTVHQIADGAVVSMRGMLEYPAFDTYAIQASGVDGSLSRRGSDGREEWLNASGAPVHGGTFGRGASQEVELDAVIDFAPFEVRGEDAVVRVSNSSDRTLTDCRFPEGFSPRDAVTLEPGASVEAGATGPIESPFFSCALPSSVVAFDDPRYPVRTEGSTLISVRLPVPRRDEDAP